MFLSIIQEITRLTVTVNGKRPYHVGNGRGGALISHIFKQHLGMIIRILEPFGSNYLLGIKFHLKVVHHCTASFLIHM